jgi:methyl coenzyme M reductase subunit D
MKTWKIEVKVKVAEIWVDDGFDLEDTHWKEYIEEKFKSMIPYAYDHEIQVEVKVKAN